MPWCGFCDRFFSDCEFGTEDYCEGCFSWLEEESLRKSKNEEYCSLHLEQDRLQSLVQQRTSLSSPSRSY